MTTSEKSELLDQLSACYNRVSHFSLLTGARDPEVLRLAQRQRTRLSAEIAVLLQGLHADWDGNAVQLKKELSGINEILTNDLAVIEKDVSVAQHVAEASGRIDDAIDIAAGLISSEDNLECYLGVYCASPSGCP